MSFLGIIGDTHIPNRLKELPRTIFRYLEGAEMILHTGDISQKAVLEQLEEVAPVLAVKGNSDHQVAALPLQREFTFRDLSITLTHSHGGLRGYIYQWLVYFTRGYTYPFHYRRVVKFGWNSQIVIFGHTHYPYIDWHDGKLLFNPGSIGPAYFPVGSGPKAGRIYAEAGKVWGEVVDLGTMKAVCKLDRVAIPNRD